MQELKTIKFINHKTDRLLNFAESLAAEKKFDYFVCGHNHVQGITELSVPKESQRQRREEVDKVSFWTFF